MQMGLHSGRCKYYIFSLCERSPDAVEKWRCLRLTPAPNLLPVVKLKMESGRCFYRPCVLTCSAKSWAWQEPSLFTSHDFVSLYQRGNRSLKWRGKESRHDYFFKPLFPSDQNHSSLFKTEIQPLVISFLLPFKRAGEMTYHIFHKDMFTNGIYGIVIHFH